MHAHSSVVVDVQLALGIQEAARMSEEEQGPLEHAVMELASSVSPWQRCLMMIQEQEHRCHLVLGSHQGEFDEMMHHHMDQSNTSGPLQLGHQLAPSGCACEALLQQGYAVYQHQIVVVLSGGLE